MLKLHLQGPGRVTVFRDRAFKSIIQSGYRRERVSQSELIVSLQEEETRDRSVHSGRGGQQVKWQQEGLRLQARVAGLGRPQPANARTF